MLCLSQVTFWPNRGYESEVAQSCQTLWDTMDCSLPRSLVHGFFQARVLKWVTSSLSRGSSQPRDWTQVSRIAGRCFTGKARGYEGTQFSSHIIHWFIQELRVKQPSRTKSCDIQTFRRYSSCPVSPQGLCGPWHLWCCMCVCTCWAASATSSCLQPYGM